MPSEDTATRRIRAPAGPSRGRTMMNKGLILTLTDAELLDLWRILQDGDRDDALTFLREHLQRPAARALEGG